MTTVEDILKSLSLGVLSNLSVGKEGSGYIKGSRLPNVIHYLDEGVKELHSQFLLSQKILTLAVFDHKTMYDLTVDNTFSKAGLTFDPDSLDPDGPNIVDSELEPFTGDLIKVMSVYTYQGVKLPIGDLEDPNSLFLPHNEVIQVPNPKNIKYLSIEYQASHEPIDIGTGECDYMKQKVNVPSVLLPALYSYIGYRTFSAMGTSESSAKSQEHFQRFLSQCQLVIDRDLVSSSTSFTNTKFYEGGWV